MANAVSQVIGHGQVMKVHRISHSTTKLEDIPLCIKVSQYVLYKTVSLKII